VGSGAWQAADGGGMTTDTTVIRPARIADVDTIARIENASFPDPWGHGEFRTVLDAPQTIFLVAEDSLSGAVTGYSIALTVLDESEILNLAVDARLRGRGVGGLLLDAALEQLRERGATAAFLEVRESNDSARRLYASRGFTEISRRRKYYRNPAEDALVLRLAM
jgi:ribosomal-protein-alanine N-acetyltransferase